MKPSDVCILLTLHCTTDRVDEYTKSLALWSNLSVHFKKIVSVDSANDTSIGTTHRLWGPNKSPSLGEKRSIMHAMPSLAGCPFIFKWTGRYYSHNFLGALKRMDSNASLVLQFLRHTRGQNSEVFGSTPTGMEWILRNVKANPYTPMETALLKSSLTIFRNSTHRLPRLTLAFPAEQKSRHFNCSPTCRYRPDTSPDIAVS